MSYLTLQERDARLARLKEIMERRSLDAAVVYYDEFNIGNGWYLTGWCPQFESGAAMVPKSGEPMILGGPESEPFAKLDSTITETRNFPVFAGSHNGTRIETGYEITEDGPVPFSPTMEKELLSLQS